METAAPGAPALSGPALEALDRTLFDSADQVALARARAACALAKKNKQFTNMNKFSLRCSDCRAGLVGQSEAVEHSRATGHRSFEEY